jgi:hypothetical protein
MLNNLKGHLRSLKLHMKRFTALNDDPPPTISPRRLGVAAQYRSAYTEALQKAIVVLGGETTEDLASVSNSALFDALRKRGFTVTVAGQMIGLTVDPSGAAAAAGGGGGGGGVSTEQHGSFSQN